MAMGSPGHRTADANNRIRNAKVLLFVYVACLMVFSLNNDSSALYQKIGKFRA
jgi:hypothetical protein